MFYRGVSEEAVTTASSNIETSLLLNTNPTHTATTNMNDDEKHLALNEFSNSNSNSIQSNGKDLIKQEPNDKHLYKFDFSNSQGNIGGVSGSTHTSTTNSASTSPSASSSASSTTNRKYSFQEHTQPPSAKRKTSDHHHHHHSHHHHNHKSNNNLHSSSSSSSSLSSSSQHQVYHKKPVYSEFVSSKCILFIYYKGDLSFVIDDHFKKSITLNAAKASSASISPLSLSSSSSSSSSSTSTSPSSKSSSKSSLHKTSNCFKIFLRKLKMRLYAVSIIFVSNVLIWILKLKHFAVTKKKNLLANRVTSTGH
jgi:trimeric autotransporter adhesin